MKSDFVIRVDSGNKIGFGHGMRCLTLANKLKKDFRISIISIKEKNNLEKEFLKKGFQVLNIKNKNKNLKKIDEKFDYEQTKKILKGFSNKPKFLLVDNYNLGKKWEKSMKQFVEKIIVIDDLNNRKHDCDLIIDQGLHNNMKNAYRKLVPKNCKILVGPKYAILRPEFSKYRQKKIERKSNIKKIFISFGGSDIHKDTIKTLQSIKNMKERKFAVDVIIGKSNQEYNTIKKMIQTMSKTRCFYNTQNVARIMHKADLAIGNGGSTAWERCCLGIPTIVSIASKNQEESTRILHKKKCIINLGNSKEVNMEKYSKVIEKLSNNELKIMRKNCIKIVDGVGLKRVIDEIFLL